MSEGNDSPQMAASAPDPESWYDDLAEALAEMAYGEGFGSIHGDEFRDDAESLAADLGPGPWELVEMECVHDNWTFIFTANGIVCGVETGEGDIIAEVLARPKR